MMTVGGVWVLFAGAAVILVIIVSPIIMLIEYFIIRRKEMSAWKELQVAETEQERRTAEACLIWEAKKEKEANDIEKGK